MPTSLQLWRVRCAVASLDLMPNTEQVRRAVASARWLDGQGLR